MAIAQGLNSTPSFPLEQRRRTIVIGVLGCGTVGGGVVDRLLRDGKILDQPARLAKVLVRDLSKARFPEAVTAYLTTDAAEIVDDPEIDIVVETIGGRRYRS